ncbi:pyridoxal phosphate-dependent decarboxylase family protein [Thermomonospora curvata]|uniref:Pyridoxal-dependent decarboxylase n=1 Tax=Thermomonospora curvata (strain ATCC 19995 / DSM 43183 / JCM 3096 / KCTC 9072 / NBRC 15933 / NCIMB 10081 / Henssen B9) TaxID=471852 RepID=D1A4S3_THECD|nr:pyridoxal-dependent decarboxylase [Thermomonospora curvata]ACY98092.1 Pyridoxal-dependent decarboxylase [Thermomonospora curvata DSM 43183]
MHDRLSDDLARLPQLLAQTSGYAADLLSGLEERPVAVPPAPRARRELPAEGKGLAGALEEFRQHWEPGFSGSAGPRYLGFVTGGATPAALVGDWLTAVLDQNPVSGLDSAAPDLEREVIGWLRELFGLGEAHSGAFVSGATASNLVGLAIAREWLGEQAGVEVSEAGAGALGPVTVLSGTPHSSVCKALSMLGLGRNALQTVPTLPGREAVDPDALEEALAALQGRPAIVVANAGTVNTGDFDDLRAIAALRERHPLWLHVDAAFGAFAALSPSHAHLVEGLDEADSVCVDLHKWGNVPYDSAVQFTRRRDLQIRVFRNSAAYLGRPTETPDLIHLTPENSRRLRALAAWFSLTAYGRDGHREIVERNMATARALGDRLSADPRWRLLAPVRLNVVCFTVADDPAPGRIDHIVKTVASGGDLFVTPTVLNGTPALRAAFSNWRTTPDHLDRIVSALNAAL